MNIYDPDEVNDNEMLTFTEVSFIIAREEEASLLWESQEDWDGILDDEDSPFSPDYTEEEYAILRSDEYENWEKE